MQFVSCAGALEGKAFAIKAGARRRARRRLRITDGARLVVTVLRKQRQDRRGNELRIGGLQERLNFGFGLRVAAFAGETFDEPAALIVKVLVRPNAVRVAFFQIVKCLVENDRPRRRRAVSRRRRPLLRSPEKSNSGVCTPTITNPTIVVSPVPFAQIRQRTQTVDARVLPEVDEHDLAAKLFGAERSAIDPAGAAVEARNPFGGHPADCQQRRQHQMH